jgi:hypothetical protein
MAQTAAAMLPCFTHSTARPSPCTVDYLLALAAYTHGLTNSNGDVMSIGLKNIIGDAPIDSSGPNYTLLVDNFDWALDEQCLTEDGGCSMYTGLISANKAVWNVEYKNGSGSMTDATFQSDCPAATAMHMNMELRDLDLVSPTDSGYFYDTCIANTATTW